MKIYLVSDYVEYDATTPYGAFTSKRKADKFIADLCKKRRISRYTRKRFDRFDVDEIRLNITYEEWMKS